MIQDKHFYGSFFGLTLSIALQGLLTYSVNFADNVMLGAYSEFAMSGVSLANQIQFLLQMLVLGASEGVIVLGARYWGSRDLAPIPHIIGAALRFGLGLAAALFVAVLCFPAALLGLLSNQPEVIAEGVAYLRIVCFTYLLFTLTNILVASLRSIGIAKIGYIISLSTLCINVSLNYCLIYGRMGFPALGVRGAAIATLVSRAIELLIVIFYLKFCETRLCLTLRKLVFIDTSYIRDYFKVSMPVILNQAQWGVAQMVQTGILGHLGAASIAANAVATNVFQITTVVSSGSTSATCILVGRALGEGREKDLRQLVHTLKRIFLAIGVCTGLFIFAVRTPILWFYRLSPESHALAMQFMAVLAVTTVGTAYQVACDNGIIRGGGDTGFSAKMNLFSMWLIVVPISAMAAFWWKLPPVAVFFFLKWDQLYKIIPVSYRLNSWKWVKKITRADTSA